MALLISVLGGGCSKGESGVSGGEAEALTEVEVWKVGSEAIKVQRHWLGSLQPLRVLSIQAPASGIVEQLNVNEGDRVKADDVLLRIGGGAFDARRQVLQERYHQLQAELDRWQRLADAGAAGPAELSEAKLRYLEVSETLAGLNAIMETATVRAPRNGRVGAIAVSRGGLVQEGVLLLQFEDEERWGLRLNVPSRQLDYLRKPESLSVVGTEGQRFKVSQVVDVGEIQGGFVAVEVLLDTGDERIRTEVELQFENTVHALIVPWTSVASEGDDHWVALVDPDSGEIERRKLRLGRAHASGVEVLDGLAEGDCIVRYEPRSHTEGTRIKPAGIQ
ncbi:MAG: efflux RND transporter periplasmic adaptor subunit [Opitutales bacterium]|nr:efflux RND transporter periplasmic adaptor subunit [Opitutales bacterium]